MKSNNSLKEYKLFYEELESKSRYLRRVSRSKNSSD